MQPLEGGGMGQHATGIYVADGIDMGYVRLHVVIDNDGAALGDDARLLQTQTVGAWSTACGYQHNIGCHTTLLALALENHFIRRNLFHS